MKRKQIITAIISVLAIVGITYAILPVHMQRALIRMKARIDDYRIFENRTVEAGSPVPWSVSPLCNEKEVPEEASRLMTELKTTAFLIVKDNRIIYEKYYKGY